MGATMSWNRDGLQPDDGRSPFWTDELLMSYCYGRPLQAEKDIGPNSGVKQVICYCAIFIPPRAAVAI